MLEVGCGTGALWVNTAALLPHLRLTLTDLSEGMVAAAAAAVAPLADIELAEARTCDAQALPFDDDAFDVVVANHMLYHVPEPRLAVAAFARVLRPGGVLLAATNGPRHLRAIADVSRATLGWSSLDFTDGRFGLTTGRGDPAHGLRLGDNAPPPEHHGLHRPRRRDRLHCLVSRRPGCVAAAARRAATMRCGHGSPRRVGR